MLKYSASPWLPFPCPRQSPPKIIEPLYARVNTSITGVAIISMNSYGATSKLEINNLTIPSAFFLLRLKNLKPFSQTGSAIPLNTFSWRCFQQRG
jgi:hypothetical protein